MKKVLIFCFFLMIHQNINAGFRNLILVIDWMVERVSRDFDTTEVKENDKFGPSTLNLVIAIDQQAAPVIVSSATWKNFVERKQIFTDAISLNGPMFDEKYLNKFEYFKDNLRLAKLQSTFKKTKSQGSSLLATLQPNMRELVKGFLLSYLTDFSNQDWHIKKITEHWYLLIPKSYLANIQQEPFKRDIAIKSKLQDSDLQLGLKWTSLPDIVDYLNPEKHNDSLGKQTNLAEQEAIGEEFLQAIKKVFLIEEDIKDPTSDNKKTEENAERYLHQWYFFSTGHGGYGSLQNQDLINGLVENNFKKLLSFFNEINTDFLFYHTCFSGGEHLKTPFETTWTYPHKKAETKADNFNFIVSAATMVYGIASIYGPKANPQATNPKEIFTFTQDFPMFFSGLHTYVHPEKLTLQEWQDSKKKGKLNLGKILNNVTVFLDEKGNVNPKMQIPVVRYPNTEWFSVIDAPDKIFKLTRILAETRAAENKEIVVKDKQALILFAESEKKEKEHYHSAVLATVKIEKEKLTTMPTVLSFTPGPAWHYFESISTNAGLTEIIQSFLPEISQLYDRAYYIKKLTCVNDIEDEKQNKRLGLEKGKQIELTDVVFFTQTNNPFDSQDKRKVNGFLIKVKNIRYYSLWESKALDKYNLLKQKQLPSIDSTYTALEYPYPFPEERVKKIIDVLKKRKKEPKEDKDKLMKLEQDLISLKQRFEQINKVLK